MQLQPTMSQLLWSEMRKSLHLSLPLIASGLAQMGMEVVDTLMMGRLGPDALASGALGSAVFMSLAVICIGLITSVGVLVAREYGAGNLSQTAIIARQGFWIAIILGIPSTAVIWYAAWFLRLIGENPTILIGTTAFLHGLAWGIFPFLGFIVLREFVAALSKPRVVMLISAAAIPFNALANYILMYGKLGFPVLGISGIGIASSLIEWGMFIALALYVLSRPAFKSYVLFRRFDLPNKDILKEMVKLGLPVAALFGLENGLFTVATLMIGFFSAITLASHQIALQSLSVAFMIPMGISQAAAVRVSQEMGARQRRKAQYAAYGCILLGIISAGIAASLFWLFPDSIIALFIDPKLPQNLPVVRLATHFLAIAAVFELMDALQVIMTGVLRGFKDTFMPMLLGLVSYWCIGISVAYLLAFVLHWEGYGVWWGLAIGISVSAILLIWRFRVSAKVRGKNSQRKKPINGQI